MADRDRQKIIALQAQVKIAREALESIGHGHTRDPYGKALEALDKIEDIQTKKLGWKLEHAHD